MLHHQVEQMLQKISPLQKCQEELGSLRAELEEKKVRRTSEHELVCRPSGTRERFHGAGGNPALAGAEVWRGLCANACGFLFPVIIVI